MVRTMPPASRFSLWARINSPSRTNPSRARELPLFYNQNQRRHRSYFSLHCFKIAMKIALACLAVLFVGQAIAMPVIRDLSAAGLEVLNLSFGARLAEVLLAISSVTLVTLVYAVLIQRGTLMATTCLYLRRPIEENIGKLLNAAWPESSARMDSVDGSLGGRMNLNKQETNGSVSSKTTAYSISLYYLGRMNDGNVAPSQRLARGQTESEAKPDVETQPRPLWITGGSPLTKSVIQLLIWEWVCLWLLLLMFLATLLFNGFFTNDLNNDSYARLVVILIYISSYAVHFCYVWVVCIKFFRNVFAGSAWSLLERAKFVVGDNNRLRRHSSGNVFEFRSIDKANESFVPQKYSAVLGSPPASPMATATSPLDSTMLSGQNSSNNNSNNNNPFDAAAAYQNERASELREALSTIKQSSNNERLNATEASKLALERVIANAMVMMAVTLSSGFASWTSMQLSSESPNNTTTTQIGSLALLASLSLGVAAMFTSAMNLNIMGAAFRTILSLKETRINGLAVDHYRKRYNPMAFGGTSIGGDTSEVEPLAFTQNKRLSPSELGLDEFLAANRGRGFMGLLGLITMGPAYALLPRLRDHDRTTPEVEVDFQAPVRSGNVVFTSKKTNRHAMEDGGRNAEPINVCYIPNEEKMSVVVEK